jgi:hypothetical protein
VHDSKEFRDFMAARGYRRHLARPDEARKFMAKSDADLGAVMKSVGIAQSTVKINDAITGARCSSLGLVILWHIQGFPRCRARSSARRGFRESSRRARSAAADSCARGVRSRGRWIASSEWTRQRRPLAGSARHRGLALYVGALEPARLPPHRVPAAARLAAHPRRPLADRDLRRDPRARS